MDPFVLGIIKGYLTNRREKLHNPAP